MTRGVWEEVQQGGYIAQELAAPTERRIKIDGEIKTLKLDVRLYTYRGLPLLVAARVYQGQTTNFRTPGGGFAPVFVTWRETVALTGLVAGWHRGSSQGACARGRRGSRRSWR